MMLENEISREIVDAAYHIHREIGPGLLESAYQRMLAFELDQRKLQVEIEVSIPLIFKGQSLGEAYRADIVVNDKIIVELKSTEVMLPLHSKQLLTYLRLANFRLGLLINFGQPLFKDGVSRVVNNLQ
jgi:GxxExxY protein